MSIPGHRAPHAARVALAPLDHTSTFADRAYTALRNVIVSLNVYDEPGEVRLDERQLAQDLGISRTPVREAMAQLERDLRELLAERIFHRGPFQPDPEDGGVEAQAGFEADHHQVEAIGQALREAAGDARASVEAIASGLGMTKPVSCCRCSICLRCSG